MPATKKTQTSPTPKSVVKNLTQDLFSQLGFSDAKIKATKEENCLKVQVDVNPDQSGILIGYHGETISSLQLILSLMVQKKIGEWHRIVININDYREKRELALKEMATDAAEKVGSTGEEFVMPPMASFDRRIIHLALTDNKDIKTESVGEGRDRRIILFPHTPKKK